MATYRTTGYGNGAGTTNSTFRTCVELYADDNGSNGYSVYAQYYVEVTRGDFYGSHISTSWGTTFTINGIGRYGNSGLQYRGVVGYGGTASASASTQYTGSSTHISNASASWSVPRPTHTVNYDANGGTGAPGSQTKVYGYILKLSTVIPVRPGYEFLGWSTSKTSSIVSYNPGDNYGADANITLYAVWKLLELLDLSITEIPDIRIPSTTLGVANISDISIPYFPKIAEDGSNYTVPYYYKVCWVDNADGNVYDINLNSNNVTYGPFTADQIGDGGDLGPGATEIMVPSDFIRKSLINTKNENEILILILTCTTNDSFDDDLTVKQLLRIPLLDFNILWIKVLECFRTLNGLQAKVQVKFPKSYTAMTSYRPPSIRIDNSETPIIPSSTASKGIDNLITYTLNLTSTQIDTSAHNLKLEISDSISDAIVYTRIGAVGSEDIYIYKDTNICKCVEFIEGDEVQFQKGGRVYANEFIENDDGVFIGDTMIFGELIEE